MFAEESSTEQWLQRGEEFMKHSLYEVAAKCFNRGKNFRMEKTAKAYQLACLASRWVLFFSLTVKMVNWGTIMKRERGNAKYHHIRSTLIFSDIFFIDEFCFKFNLGLLTQDLLIFIGCGVNLFLELSMPVVSALVFCLSCLYKSHISFLHQIT